LASRFFVPAYGLAGLTDYLLIHRGCIGRLGSGSAQRSGACVEMMSGAVWGRDRLTDAVGGR